MIFSRLNLIGYSFVIFSSCQIYLDIHSSNIYGHKYIWIFIRPKKLHLSHIYMKPFFPHFSLINKVFSQVPPAVLVIDDPSNFHDLIRSVFEIIGKSHFQGQKRTQHLRCAILRQNWMFFFCFFCCCIFGTQNWKVSISFCFHEGLKIK